MRVNTDTFLPSTSAAASVTSLAYPLTQVALMCVSAQFTGGTLSGAAKLQVSNEPTTQSDPSYQPDGATFADYTGSSQTVSGTGPLIWDVADVGFNWVRIVYTAASGTGTIVGKITTKGN